MPRSDLPISFRLNWSFAGVMVETSFFEGDAFNQRLTSSPPFALGSNVTAAVPLIQPRAAPSVSNKMASLSNSARPPLLDVARNQQPAYVNEYSLTTEYALTYQLSLSAGYLGESGHHLADYRNGNQYTLAQQPCNPDQG